MNLESQELIWFVLDLSLRCGLMMAAVAMSLRIFRIQASSQRHFVWLLAVIGMLGLAPLGRLMPALPLPVVSAPASITDSSGESTGQGERHRAPDSERTSARLERTRSAAAGPTTESGVDGAMPWTVGSLLAAAYLLGLIVLGGRILLGLALRQKMLFEARSIGATRSREAAKRISSKAGLTPPLLLESKRTRVPFAMGGFRRLIVLPESWRNWPQNRLEAVLAHEVAHLKRRDSWAHWLGVLNRTLYWFHPAAHWASREMTVLAEKTCDQLAIRWTRQQPKTYGRHLIHVAAELQRGRAPAWMGGTLMARESQVEERIEALLSLRPSQNRRSWATLPALVVILASAGFHFAQQPEPREPATVRVPTPTPQPTPSPAPQPTPTPRLQGSGNNAEIGQSSGPKVRVRPGAGTGRSRPRPTPDSSEVRQWVEMLRSPQAGERAEAAWRLKAAPPSEEAVSALLSLLGDRTPVEPGGGWGDYWNSDRMTDPGSEAARTLGEYSEGRLEEMVISRLISLSSGGTLEVRHDAVRALGFAESPLAGEALAGALQDAEWRIRKMAAWGLGVLESPHFIPELGSAVGDPESEVRAMAAWGLGVIEDAKGLEALAMALQDSVDSVRENAAWSMGVIEDSRAVEFLSRAVNDPAPQVRENVVWALGVIESDSAVPALSEAMLGDENSLVRENAAWALGVIESSAAIEALEEALSDSAVPVRRKAAWALGLIESDPAVPALTRALQDEDAELRATAAWALGLIESSRAVPALSAALTDSESAVREKAAWALGLIESSEALPALLAALEDANTAVSGTAAWALGLIGDERALEALQRIADDESEPRELRKKADWAIGVIR